MAFGTSLIGSALGEVVDWKITKNISKSNNFYDKYLEKTFNAGLRLERGKSSSSLLRQARKFLNKSDFYINAKRGVSSIVGSSTITG